MSRISNVKNVINSLMLFIYKIIFDSYTAGIIICEKKSVEILKAILLRISNRCTIPGPRERLHIRGEIWNISRSHFNILEPASQKWRGATPINPAECPIPRVRARIRIRNRPARRARIYYADAGGSRSRESASNNPRAFSNATLGEPGGLQRPEIVPPWSPAVQPGPRTPFCF